MLRQHFNFRRFSRSISVILHIFEKKKLRKKIKQTNKQTKNKRTKQKQDDFSPDEDQRSKLVEKNIDINYRKKSICFITFRQLESQRFKIAGNNEIKEVKE